MSDANTPDFPSLNSIISLDELPTAPIQPEIISESVSSTAEDIHAFEVLFSASEIAQTQSANDDLSDQPLTENTDWFTLAHKLHQQNQDLLKTVAQLEQAFAQSQQQLQSQVKRSHSQQAEELHKVETLSQQLKTSQQQVAQLERQFVLLQEESKDKTQKLLASEKQVRELQSRLQRQQRHTLQYKAALDSKVADSTVQKVTSIQPWSSQTTSQEQNLNEESSSGASAEVIVEVKQPTREIEITSDSETVCADTNSELDNTQSVTNQETTSSQVNWLSYRISPRTSQSKPSIDLPNFLRDRSS